MGYKPLVNNRWSHLYDKCRWCHRGNVFTTDNKNTHRHVGKGLGKDCYRYFYYYLIHKYHLENISNDAIHSMVDFIVTERWSNNGNIDDGSKYIPNDNARLKVF
jgi:hypothetical protein